MGSGFIPPAIGKARTSSIGQCSSRLCSKKPSGGWRASLRRCSRGMSRLCRRQTRRSTVLFSRPALLGLNRYVFGFGLLPLRDGHLQDAVLELGGGVLRLDGRRQGDGPRERPIVEFPLVIILVFRSLILLHFAFEC